MGHRVEWLGLALAGSISLGGGGTAGAQEDLVFKGVPGTVAASGTINVRQEVTRQRLAARTAVSRPSPAAAPAPMPIPDMPPLERKLPAVDLGRTTPAALADLPTPQAPSLTASFPALEDSNTAIPPDTYGAVGPNHLMVTLNTQVRFQDKTGGVLGTLGLNGFWSAVNGGNGAFDPRVVFDQLAGRWVAVAGDDAQSASAGVLVGVSRTADPTGTWDLFKISTGGGNWADYPTLGFNKNWVAIQVNIFDSGNAFVESRVYAISRIPFFGGPPATLSYRTVTLTGVSGTQVPAVTFDPALALDDLYLLQTWSSAGGQLRLWRLTGPLGSETVESIGFPDDSFQWSSGVSADLAPQLQGPPGCSYCPSPPCRIQTNDARIHSVVYRGGRIWATHTVFLPTGVPTRSSIQWWQVNPDATVGQRGLVDDATGARFFAFPSLAVNRNDDVLLGYSRFQGDQFAGASYSFRTAIDPPNTMQTESPLKDGEACYFKDYGLAKNRWGDYSATVVDPVDDKTLWTIQEYAAPPNVTYPNPQQRDRWGTWWGQVDPTPRIVITDATASENAPPGTSKLVFDVRLLASDLLQPLATSQTVTVQWATADGTATVAGGDYVAGSGTLTFAPGETSKAIEVTVNGDTNIEGSETLRVNLSVPVDATLADNQGQGTILDLPAPQVSIGDVTLVEGTGVAGTETSFVFPVTLSHPSDSNVTVSWATANGTAAAGAWGTGDIVGVGLTPLTFTPGVVAQTVTVQVHADTLVEPDPDEVFYVDLSSPSGATIVRPRGVGRIQDDDAPYPGVIGLSILADSVGSGANQGRNRLQWFTPTAAAGANQTHIEYNEGSSCSSPLSIGSGTGVIDLSPVTLGQNGYPHTGRTLGWQYCYSLWLDYGGGNYSPRVSLSARPFDSTPLSSRVRWKLSTGMTLMAAPTVGVDAVIAVSNDMSVQALQRDPATGTGGLWPGSWKPVRLGSVAQHRPPVVPLTGGSRAFVATQDGRIHAMDTANGTLIWSTQLPEADARGAPAGIFTAHGGDYDYVLVGTSSASLADHFYALDPGTGAVIDAFPGPADGVGGNLGEVLGTAAVDYATNRVYFASRRDTALRSLWCLDLGPSSDALRLRWSRDLGGDVDGSPVLRGGRLYVADNTPVAWSIPADTGGGGYSIALGGSATKGFLFPDRRNGDLYVATGGAVHGLTDTGSALNPKWTPIGLDQPSIVLLRPGTNELYVGVRDYSTDASLLRIDTTSGTVAGSVSLETDPRTVGAPSLDVGYGIVHVGSELGILYAVQLPF
jgi:hypothetical protein